MEERYYVILSEGSYSYYSPTYFVGSLPISKEELEFEAKRLGDELYDWLDSLPIRPSKSKWASEGEKEVYDPTTWETFYSSQLAERFMKQMTTWVKERGFEELPEEIPEINVAYSDLPTNRERK